MKRMDLVRREEKGSVIMVVVLILIAISALALTAINFSAMDVNMAASYKFDKEVFANADSCINGVPPYIDLLFPNAEPIKEDDVRVGCVQFLNTSQPDTAREIMNRFYGFPGDVTAQYNTPALEGDSEAADISMEGCDIPCITNVDPKGGGHMSGGGVEFGVGAEGIGVGGMSGAAKQFRLIATGRDHQNVEYKVRAIYRWVDVARGE